MSDGNIRIIEMTAADAVEDNDFLAIDNNSVAQSNDDTTAGTRKVRAKDFVQASLTVDETPTEDSENFVTSGGVYDAVDGLNDKITSMEIIGTASGEIATFDDGSANPIKELTAQIVAVQSGSGEPYPAGGGKNKLPLSLENLKTLNTGGTWNNNVYRRYDVTFTVNTDEGGNVTGIKVNGTASANTYLLLTSTEVHDEYLGLVMNGCPATGSSSTYLMTGYNATDSTSIGVNDTGTGATIPTNLSGKQFRLYIAIFSGYQANNLMFYPMLRNSSDSATFAPYSNIRPISGWDGANVWVQAEVDPTAEADYSISWQTQCGIVYGGDFKIFKSGGKWYITINGTHEKVYLGDIEWVKGGNNFISNALDSLMLRPSSASVTANMLCSALAVKNQGNYAQTNNSIAYYYTGSDSTTSKVICNSTDYDSADAFKTAMDGEILVYELETPTTTTFEISTEIATLLGNNNIFADCGDVDVTYQRDLNIVINKLLSSVQFLTQAQYDALPSSKNTDGVIYYVN